MLKNNEKRLEAYKISEKKIKKMADESNFSSCFSFILSLHGERVGFIPRPYRNIQHSFRGRDIYLSQ